MYQTLAVGVWIIGGCLSFYIGSNNIILGLFVALVILVLGSLCWAIEEVISRLEQIINNQLVESSNPEKLVGRDIVAIERNGNWYCEQCKMHNKETRKTCSNCRDYRK